MEISTLYKRLSITADVFIPPPVPLSAVSYLEYPLVKDKNNEYILYDEETDSNIIINKSYVVQAIVSDQKKEEKTKIKTQKDKTKENQPEKSKRKKK